MASMLHDKKMKCCPHLAQLCESAICGQKQIIEVAEQMMHDTDALPDDLKPFAELLDKITIEMLIKCFAESLLLSSELGLQEIARTTATSDVAVLSPNHQTEKE
jgi:hypothetical protein